MEFKSGFISIIGRPNAGKSTLMNALLNEKVAIISPKPQTTRNNIQGILTTDDTQYVFIDTPGIHKPKHELGRTLNKNAYNALKDVDLVYYMVDASIPFGSGDEFMLELLKNVKAPVFLLLNKIDLLNKDDLLKLLIKWQSRYNFKEIFPVSALVKDNLEALLSTTREYLDYGPKFFPDTQISDHGESFLISEMIREKVLYKTEEEIPHSVAVVVENMEEKGSKTYIQALVVVERDSQKGILIGKQGSMIRNIKLSAQKDISLVLGKRVELELYVRVEKNWRNRQSKLQQFGISEIEIDE